MAVVAGTGAAPQADAGARSASSSSWGMAVVAGGPAAVPTPPPPPPAPEPRRRAVSLASEEDLGAELELGAQVGEDALGLVYLGRRRSDGAPCRVRVLAAHPHALERARAWVGFTHAHVVGPWKVGRLAGRAAIVGPASPGAPLTGPLSSAAALRVVLQLARGLAWAHVHGLSHGGPILPASVHARGGDALLVDPGLGPALVADGTASASSDVEALALLLAHLVAGGRDAPAEPTKVPGVGGACRRLAAAADVQEAIGVLEALAPAEQVVAPAPTVDASASPVASTTRSSSRVRAEAASPPPVVAPPPSAPPTRPPPDPSRAATDWGQLGRAGAGLVATVTVLAALTWRAEPKVAPPPPPPPPPPAIQPGIESGPTSTERAERPATSTGALDPEAEARVVRERALRVDAALQGARYDEALLLVAQAREELAAGAASSASRARLDELEARVRRDRAERVRVGAQQLRLRLDEQDLDGAAAALDALRELVGEAAALSDPEVARAARELARWRDARAWEVARLEAPGALDVEAAQNLLTTRLTAWRKRGALYPRGGVALRYAGAAELARDLTAVQGAPGGVAPTPLGGADGLRVEAAAAAPLTLRLPLPLRRPLDVRVDVVVDREPAPQAVLALLVGSLDRAVGAAWGAAPSRLVAGRLQVDPRPVPRAAGALRLELRVEPLDGGGERLRLIAALHDLAQRRPLGGCEQVVGRDELRGELLLHASGGAEAWLTGLEVRGVVDGERLR